MKRRQEEIDRRNLNNRKKRWEKRQNVFKTQYLWNVKNSYFNAAALNIIQSLFHLKLSKIEMSTTVTAITEFSTATLKTTTRPISHSATEATTSEHPTSMKFAIIFEHYFLVDAYAHVEHWRLMFSNKISKSVAHFLIFYFSSVTSVAYYIWRLFDCNI